MRVSYLLHLLPKISKKLFRTGGMARTSLLQGIYYSVTKLHHKNYPMSLFSGGICASCKLFSSAVLDWYHIRGGGCYFCIPQNHSFQFVLGSLQCPRETANNILAKW